MANNLQISFDSQQVSRLLSYLDGIDNGAEKALYRTLTATQKKAKKEASTLIRKQLKLSKAYVDSKLKTGKPSYSNLTASVRAEKRGILLTRFEYRKNPIKGKGYQVKIKPTGGFKNFPHVSLLRNLKNSGVDGLASWEGGKWEMKYGPSVSQVMNTFLPTLSEQMSTYAAKQLEKEVSGVLRQKGF